MKTSLVTVDTEYLWNIHKYNPVIYKLDSISWPNWYILGAQVDMTLETQQNISQYNSRECIITSTDAEKASEKN